MKVTLTPVERSLYEQTYRDLRLKLIQGRCDVAYVKYRLDRLLHAIKERAKNIKQEEEEA